MVESCFKLIYLLSTAEGGDPSCFVYSIAPFVSLLADIEMNIEMLVRVQHPLCPHRGMQELLLVAVQVSIA